MTEKTQTPDNRDPGEKLQSLDWDIQPDRDLWPGISARIRAPERPHAYRRSWFPAAMAASLVVAVTALSFSYFSFQNVRQTNAQIAALAELQKAQIAILEQQHALVRTQFAALLEDTNGALNPVLVSEIKSALADFDRASAEIKNAIAVQPNDPRYASMLMNAYQQEVRLLKKIQSGQALAI